MTEHAQTQTTRRPNSLRAIWQHLLRSAALARSRGQLTMLDDHQLRDIGRTRAEAEAEATRPTWDVPPHWRC